MDAIAGASPRTLASVIPDIALGSVTTLLYDDSNDCIASCMNFLLNRILHKNECVIWVTSHSSEQDFIKAVEPEKRKASSIRIMSGELTFRNVPDFFISEKITDIPSLVRYMTTVAHNVMSRYSGILFIYDIASYYDSQIPLESILGISSSFDKICMPVTTLVALDVRVLSPLELQYALLVNARFAFNRHFFSHSSAHALMIHAHESTVNLAPHLITASNVAFMQLYTEVLSENQRLKLLAEELMRKLEEAKARAPRPPPGRPRACA
eukprot:gnl/Chilomastix_cuspidata/3293.p1 GENE.gnl/Chilomastix_cuspidata/3293~~gnl/Chilomastix_cuspidata/3293.p1  ORF type:complete len:267 (+),score=115.60 gnl/Chilomastix_cuspidata/3293:439-1239(+)